MIKHRIYRDGRLFDELDPESHVTVQITRSYALDFPGSTFVLKDENGNAIYECCVTVNPQKMWPVKNGPFFTGGETTVKEVHHGKAE